MRDKHLSKKIWIAISTPFQVNFFYPIIQKMGKKYDFIITARNHDRIFSMLDAKGLEYIPIGKHGGSTLEGKLQAYAQNVQEFAPIIKDQKPDLLLTERWPAAVRVAFGFDIPAWAIYYDEREHHVNRMVFPLASKVFAPSFYTSGEMRQHGVYSEKIVWFNGFHTCYLKDQIVSQSNPFQELGLKSPIVLIRPEPEFATFFGRKQEVLEGAVALLADHNDVEKEFNMVVFPRNEKQASSYAKYPVTVMTDAIYDNPVAYVDVAVGAAETMLMEAFVLGKPAISTIYWPESKPVIELHKYIPHITAPKEVATKTLEYLSVKEQHEFYEQSKLIVDLMESPILKIEKEIDKFYGEYKPTKFKSQKRRSQLDICVDILQAVAFRPLKLTQIMQMGNLSYSRAKKDIMWLAKRGVIEMRNDATGEHYFKTTKEGLKILTDYRRVVDKLSGLE